MVPACYIPKAAACTVAVVTRPHIFLGSSLHLGRLFCCTVLFVYRDEDHLALFIELLGRIPKRISGTGKYAKDYFNRHGELRHIKKMRFWPLEKVLTEKYHLPEDEVRL